ncbi:phosphoribosyltransferase-like protein [Flavobacterium fluviale]|uniref:Uncharacterized protein n=1 Tax=Flavobacterium fluviale TaxID=2249356 RepID=A0A344LUT9_9FLAO|nr:hypothetical protein [Flavobacterium fluviale]AXB57681.1 hypothetical protein HYN86_14180 [Flavobacterium fluviale]
MSFNINIDNTELEILSGRLKHVVSPLDIVKWLGNFEEHEIDLAKKILSNLTVYTTYEIESILNDAFVNLFPKNVPDGHQLIVNDVGEFGKSGSMIAYFFQKTSFYKKNAKSIKLVNNLKDISYDNFSIYSLIMLDDFVGTGDSVKDYFYVSREYMTAFANIYFIGIAGMRNGIKNLKGLFTKVVIPPSNIFKKAFAPDASYFGYRKHVPYRDMAFKYGKSLSQKKSKVGKKEKFINALGYDNSQALVSFAYGSPNNTLPIIWASTTGWIPLIPRFSPDKMHTSRELRKNISYELSILKEFGTQNLKDNFFSFKIKKGKKEFSSVSSTDFSIYSIIKLSRQGFLTANICHKLGIMQKDYDQYILNGREKGIFEPNGKLTSFGLSLYMDAKKCIERNKKMLYLDEKINFEIKVIDYIPKKFNGRS